MRSTLLPLLLLTLAAAPAHGQWSTAHLSRGRASFAATAVGDVALFAGGGDGFSATDAVDIYDAATDSWSTATLSGARSFLDATAVGQYALFAGGYTGSAVVATVDVFDVTTRTWSTASLSQARGGLAATTVGSKALFAGGLDATGVASARVDIYDAAVGPPSDPTAWTTATLSRARATLAATTAGGQALFAGGDDNFQVFADVDIYDSATNTWSVSALSQGRRLGWMAAASVGNLAFFGGGQTTPQTPSDVVDIYDAASHTWSSARLSLARGVVTVTAVGSTVFFAGGTINGNTVHSDVIDSYDVRTRQWDSTQRLAEARFASAGTVVRGRVMIAGGATGPRGFVTTVVDVFDTPTLESVRLGTPPNPDALRPGQTSGPVLGATWDPVVDHATFLPTAVVDVLMVAARQTNLPSPLGTVLADPIGALLLTTGPGTPFALPIPSVDALVGAELTAQGGAATMATVALANALDIRIGTR